MGLRALGQRTMSRLVVAALVVAWLAATATTVARAADTEPEGGLTLVAVQLSCLAIGGMCVRVRAVCSAVQLVMGSAGRGMGHSRVPSCRVCRNQS